MKKIVVFGAGLLGKKACMILNEKIDFVVDNDIEKQGKNICGKEVKSPEVLGVNPSMYEVLIANANHRKTIEDQLDKIGVTNQYIFRDDFDRFIDEYKKLRNNTVVLIVENIDEKDFEKYKKDIQFLADLCLQNVRFECGIYANYRKVLKNKDFSHVFIFAPTNHAEISCVAEKITNAIVIDWNLNRNLLDVNTLVLETTKEEWEAQAQEEYWNNLIEKGATITAVDNYVKEAVEISTNLPLRTIEIETINRCNGKCMFCPVNAEQPQRKKAYMSDELFEKIINELAENDYSGRLSLFSNNEPFLDKNIVKRQKYARIKLPKAKMQLLTNGTLMELEQFIQIINYLDELVIDNYNTVPEMLPKVKKVLQYCEENKKTHFEKKLTIHIRRENAILSSRGGDAPVSYYDKRFAKHTCALPFQQMVIRPTGEVSLCCNDPLGKITIGDLKTEKLLEIWNGKKFVAIRKEIAQGRINLEHCIRCNHFQIV